MRRPKPVSSKTKEVQRHIVRRIVRRLLGAGYEITINEGEDSLIPWTKEENKILGAVFTSPSDQQTLLARKPTSDARLSWIRLVYDAGTRNIVNDYSKSLEPILGRTNTMVWIYTVLTWISTLVAALRIK